MEVGGRHPVLELSEPSSANDCLTNDDSATGGPASCDPSNGSPATKGPASDGFFIGYAREGLADDGPANEWSSVSQALAHIAMAVITS